MKKGKFQLIKRDTLDREQEEIESHNNLRVLKQTLSKHTHSLCKVAQYGNK